MFCTKYLFSPSIYQISLTSHKFAMINDMLDITYRKPRINLWKYFKTARVLVPATLLVLCSHAKDFCFNFPNIFCENILSSVLNGGEHACWVRPAGLVGRKGGKYLHVSETWKYFGNMKIFRKHENIWETWKYLGEANTCGVAGSEKARIPGVAATSIGGSVGSSCGRETWNIFWFRRRNIFGF